MSDVPEIVKLLQEEEKLGKFSGSQSQSVIEPPQMTEESSICKESDDSFYGFEKEPKEVKEIDLGSIGEKYKTLFENYAVAITLADEKERIVSWNKYAEQLFNMNEKELFMKPVSSLYPKDEWKKIRAENVRKKGMKYKMETRIIKKGGGLIDVEVSLCVLKGAEGKTAGSIGIIKDITKLKTAERKLTESEERYRTIFENSAVAIMLTDENERIISWNKYAEDLLHMDKNDLYMKPVSLLYPIEEWKKIRAENVRQKGMQHHLETKILKKNNELLDVDISLSVLKNHEGDIVGSIGVIKDITEQKEIEQKLNYQHGLLQSLLDNIPDSIYFKDKKCKFIKVNKAKAAHSKVKPEDMIGKTDFDFLAKEEASEIREDDKKVMETRRSIVNKIEKITDAKGVEHWVSATKTPRYDEEGNIVGTMGISRDITRLKKSEKKYKELFENATDPIMILDKGGFFVDVNHQVIKMLGYSKKDLIGNKFDELGILSKKSVGKVLDNFIKRMNGKKVPTYEVEVIGKNGEKIHAEINASALYEDGVIIGDLVILRDLHERYKRRKVEKDLVESEKKFKDIFNATSDFLLYLEKGIILDINDSALSIGGLKKEEIIGKSFSVLKGFCSEEEMDRHIKAIDKATQGLKVSDYETDVISNDGKKFRFLFSNDLIEEKEEIKGILVRGRDVTQRQRAWDDLVKLEEKYRALAETSADGVLTIDSLGRLTYVNPSFEKMCGRRKSEILATLFRDYLSEDSVYFFQQILVDVRKTDEKIENVELELCHCDGDIIPIEVNIAPLNKEGEFTGMVCTLRDITERRKIEDELKKSERLKTEFMNIAAHELKSPVTPIKGYLDLIIQDKEASEQLKNWAKIGLRNAERLLKLVNDILDVSRLDSDTMRFDMEKLNPVEILEEIAEDMKPSITDKNLELLTKIPKTLPSIIGDRNRLSQVLKNLLVNAVKFTDHGAITIGAEKEKDDVLIYVEDTGVGISDDEVKKIFTKFYQAYTGDDRKSEGTGLGLFICKEIVGKHNGEIWAESKLRSGSKFVIKLPYIHKMTVDFKS